MNKPTDEIPTMAFKVEGPPITKELQQVFGAYGTVTGIVVMNDGIHVSYESGGSVRFIAVTP